MLRLPGARMESESEKTTARSEFVELFRRSCLQEVEEPIRGHVKGTFPSWLRGRLLRNGPGLNEIGPDRYKHAFDGMALLREFRIDNGEVSFRNRFLRSQAYVRNKKANRIVVSEFGTAGHPDPCAGIFERLFSAFTTEFTDNALVNVKPIGDEFYAMTETPFLHRIEPATLDTLNREDLRKVVALHLITAHPHIDPDDGSTYNVGTQMGRHPSFVLVRFPSAAETPSGLKSVEAPRVVGTIPMQSRLSPSYIHSFALTEHWLIVLEQSVTYHVTGMFLRRLFTKDFSDNLKFDTAKKVRFHVMNKTTGELHRTVLEAAPFFTFHHINAFEKGDDIVLDISAYDDDSVLRSLSFVKSGKDKELIFHSAVTRRFILPMKEESPSPVMIHPKRIGDGLRGELATINYERLNGKEYRFAYLTSHLDNVPEKGFLAKLDMETGEWKRWEKPGWLPSEPIFVATPGAVDEDDGVVLCCLWNPKNENQLSLVALNGQSFEELGSAEFETPSANPGDFHGWFMPEK